MDSCWKTRWHLLLGRIPTQQQAERRWCVGGVTICSCFIEANSAHSFIHVGWLTFIIRTEPKTLPNRVRGVFLFFPTSPVLLFPALAVTIFLSSAAWHVMCTTIHHLYTASLYQFNRKYVCTFDGIFLSILVYCNTVRHVQLWQIAF